MTSEIPEAIEQEAPPSPPQEAVHFTTVLEKSEPPESPQFWKMLSLILIVVVIVLAILLRFAHW